MNHESNGWLLANRVVEGSIPTPGVSAFFLKLFSTKFFFCNICSKCSTQQHLNLNHPVCNHGIAWTIGWCNQHNQPWCTASCHTWRAIQHKWMGWQTGRWKGRWTKWNPEFGNHRFDAPLSISTLSAKNASIAQSISRYYLEILGSKSASTLRYLRYLHMANYRMFLQKG